MEEEENFLPLKCCTWCPIHEEPRHINEEIRTNEDV